MRHPFPFHTHSPSGAVSGRWQCRRHGSGPRRARWQHRAAAPHHGTGPPPLPPPHPPGGPVAAGPGRCLSGGAPRPRSPPTSTKASVRSLARSITGKWRPATILTFSLPGSFLLLLSHHRRLPPPPAGTPRPAGRGGRGAGRACAAPPNVPQPPPPPPAHARRGRSAPAAAAAAGRALTQAAGRMRYAAEERGDWGGGALGPRGARPLVGTRPPARPRPRVATPRPQPGWRPGAPQLPCAEPCGRYLALQLGCGRAERGGAWGPSGVKVAPPLGRACSESSSSETSVVLPLYPVFEQSAGAVIPRQYRKEQRARAGIKSRGLVANVTALGRKLAIFNKIPRSRLLKCSGLQIGAGAERRRWRSHPD